MTEPMLLTESVAILTEYFVGDASMKDTLDRVVQLTIEAVPPAEFAGITMIVDDAMGTYVFTHPVVPEIDGAQYDSGVGPCVDAYRTGSSTMIRSTRSPGPWPEFCRTAAAHGVLSTLSVPMATNHGVMGALNLYADVEEAFGPTDVEAAGHFATQAAFLLANAQAYWDARSLSEGLRTAMEHRAAIEQAKGLIIGATGCSPDEAFQQLKSQSQHENVKLRDIAARLLANAQGRAHEPERDRSEP